MDRLVERAVERARDTLSREMSGVLREAAARGVCRWEWWTVQAMLDRPAPLVRERLGGRAPVRRRDAPGPEESADAYGYDAGDRVVWGKTVMHGVAEPFNRYFGYAQDGVETACYLGERCDLAEFALVADGKVTAFARVPAEGGSWTERFDYDEHGRLSRVFGRVDYPHLAADYAFETIVSHDAAGRLSEIIETDSRGFREVAFRARKPSKRAVLADLAERLAAAIIEAAKVAPATEPVYALLLHYEEEAPVPPSLLWAPERHRAAVPTLPSPGRHTLWDPAEIHRAYEISDASALRVLHPEITVLAADVEDLDPSGNLARRALHLTCRRLNAIDWSAHPVTDDFVVLCVDVHHEHFDDDVRGCIPDPALRRRIRAAG